MYIPRDPTLSLSTLIRRQNVELPPPLAGGEIIYYGYGRIALWYALKILNASTTANILVPSYICTSAVEPLLDYGVYVKYYRILRTLSPDIEDILDKINGNTKALLIVHYFGFPQPVEQLYKICKAKNIFLIEDCAHAFLSKKGNRFLGTFGDLSIFSLRKTLPIPNGAALLINNHSIANSQTGLSVQENERITKATIGLLLRNIETRSGISLDPIRKLKGILYAAFADDSDIGTQAKISYKINMSKLSQRILRNLYFDKIVQKRRLNYQFLSTRIKEIDLIKLVFNKLPKGVCPQILPILVPNRNYILSEMENNGIPAYYWPDLPKAISKTEFSNTIYLAEHLLALPVHQNITRKHLAKTVRLLTNLLE